jgi:simple sugar transport system permease protein
MTGLLTLAFVGAALRITVPYALAALGGTFSERSGVINLALEGLLLIGAFGATVAAYFSGSALLGVLGGVAAGLLTAAVYAVCVLIFRADQVVCGVAINLIADGLTRFLLKATFGSSSNSPRIVAFGERASSLWMTISHPLVVATVALVALSHVFLKRTPFGLRIRAAGEHPEAARSLGVPVLRIRWVAVLLSGALAGMGGAWLAVDQRQFVAGMSNGRGYIAIAALIFGGWRPVPGAIACLTFGFAEALDISLQASGAIGPTHGWWLQMLPYALTVALLAGAGAMRRLRRRARSGVPAALGRPM